MYVYIYIYPWGRGFPEGGKGWGGVGCNNGQSLVALDEFGSIHPTPQLYAFIFEVVGGIG